jgi:Ca2+-binding EF-hand superfamily protein
MSVNPFPEDWLQEAFQIPGLEQGAFDPKPLLDIFKEIDTDNKGYVTRDDLRNLMNVIGETVDEIDLDEMMRLADPENAGSVQRDQFIECFMYPSPLFFNEVAFVDPALAKLPTKKKRKGKNQVQDDVATDLYRASQERQDLFESLLEGARVTSNDLQEIVSRFDTIDKHKRNTVKYTDLLRGVQINDSEASQNVFEAFARDGANEVDWKEFVVGLSLFADMPREDRVRFAFKMFDRNNSGSIDRSELTRIVRSAAPSWAQPQWISRRVDELYDSLSLRRDTDIDQETFLLLADEHPHIIAPELIPS